MTRAEADHYMERISQRLDAIEARMTAIEERTA